MTKQQEKYATFFTKKGGKKRDRVGRGGAGKYLKSTLSYKKNVEATLSRQETH